MHHPLSHFSPPPALLAYIFWQVYGCTERQKSVATRPSIKHSEPSHLNWCLKSSCLVTNSVRAVDFDNWTSETEIQLIGFPDDAYRHTSCDWPRCPLNLQTLRQYAGWISRALCKSVILCWCKGKLPFCSFNFAHNASASSISVTLAKWAVLGMPWKNCFCYFPSWESNQLKLEPMPPSQMCKIGTYR